MRIHGRIVGLVIFGLILAGCHVREGKRPPRLSPPQPATRVGTEQGDEAPPLVGEDLHGNRIELSAYRGKVVLLDFWRHD